MNTFQQCQCQHQLPVLIEPHEYTDKEKYEGKYMVELLFSHISKQFIKIHFGYGIPYYALLEWLL